MPNINDIEPIVTNSFNIYIYLFLSLVITILVTLLVLFFRYRKSKKVDCKNPYDNLDFNNPSRELLYEFTVIAKEHKQNSKLDALLKELEKYKYSKSAKDIDEDIINRLKEFIKDEQPCK